MTFVLLVYLIRPDYTKLVTKVKGFTSIEKCFKASESAAIESGPGKLAFNCELEVK